MASASATALCPNHVRNSPSLLIPAVSSNPLTVSQNSKRSFSLPAKTGSRRAHNLKLKHPPTPCASAEGVCAYPFLSFQFLYYLYIDNSKMGFLFLLLLN